jgi:hypothetical protein
MNHLEKAPSLTVRRLNLRTEQESMTGVAQSQTKLDILDGAPVRLVESIRRLEHLSSNRAATRPERGRVAPAQLVDMMMQEISITRDQPSLGRPVVVRAEKSGQIWVDDKLLLYTAHRLRVHGHVAVNENDDLSRAGAHSAIASRGRSQWPKRDGNNFAPMRAGDRCRVVVGAVIDHHDFIRLSNGDLECFKTLREVRHAVPHWNNDAQGERGSICGRESFDQTSPSYLSARAASTHSVRRFATGAGILNFHLRRVSALVSQ